MNDPISQIRAHFPALTVTDNGRPRLYFDTPAGSQVPKMVVERMADYMLSGASNVFGGFASSKKSTEIMIDAHQAIADLFNAQSPEEIILGPNMTALTFMISRFLGHILPDGGDILVTHMDHDANISPWIMMAEEKGLKVNWLGFNRDTYDFDLEALEAALTPETRFVALPSASNITGTICKAVEMTRLIKERLPEAIVYLDTVQHVPHAPLDVQDLGGADFASCSIYKFFGPHQGAIWGKRALLERLTAFDERYSKAPLPKRFELGSQNYEAMAGVSAACDYLAWIGREFAPENDNQYAHMTGRRRDLHKAMAWIQAYERDLSTHLVTGLAALPGIHIVGVSDPAHMDRRLPTVTFTADCALSSADLVRALNDENVFCWHIQHYARDLMTYLGLFEQGGVRVGLAHYHTKDEIDHFLKVLKKIIH